MFYEKFGSVLWLLQLKTFYVVLYIFTLFHLNLLLISVNLGRLLFNWIPSNIFFGFIVISISWHQKTEYILRFHCHIHLLSSKNKIYYLGSLSYPSLVIKEQLCLNNYSAVCSISNKYFESLMKIHYVCNNK